MFKAFIVEPYRGFLELPVTIVLGGLWLLGTMLLGTVVLTIYLVISEAIKLL